MVTSLCKHYSPPLLSLPPPDALSEDEPYHPFPPPSVLATPEVSSILRSLGFGYRAEFIQRTAEMLVETHGSKVAHNAREASENWLMTLRDVDASKARDELLKFIGVGRKVADCVLLMSLDKVNIFFQSKYSSTNTVSRPERSDTRRYTCPPNCYKALWSSWSIWCQG